MRLLWPLLLLASYGSAHVRLAYPLARAPALDYFSTANSNFPCGVPKPAAGEGVRTYLKAGSIVDIEWFTAIPHMGGIRLEVLNAMDQPVAIFANFNEPYNVSETSRPVELPADFECSNCAIRITHQATEYGDSYHFFSCADINIVKDVPDGDSCLARGTRVNGKCLCDLGFDGEQCQYEVECNSDDDCGVQGVCHKRQSSVLESECFCPNGRYGEKCEKESSDVITTLADFDPSKYNMREAQDNKIYWRIIKDEIEMVLRYPGNSWAAIGWKPKDAVCPTLSMPLPSSTPVTTTTQATTTLRKVEINKLSSEKHQKETTKDAIKNTLTHESNDKGDDCGPSEQWSECPEESRSCEASCDWTRFPETIPNCPRQCGAPRCVCKEGYVRLTNDEETCVPFDFCDKESQPSCPANSTWAKCGVACEPSCSNMYDTAPCPASCESAACTCADNYVRHNGQCVYWGDCPEIDNHTHEHHANEMVTARPVSVVMTQPTRPPTTARPLSTVQPNLSCAVNETINECGKVCEADCVTVFTRGECNDCAFPECSCIQGYARTQQGQCVYWGDCPVDGSGLQTRGTPRTATDSPRTTPKRELKPKVDGDVCYGEFRFPPGCKDCDYKLAWNYVEDSDEIEFSLETKMNGNAWTGVGFSQDGSMVGADMLIVKSQNGELSVHDMSSEGYGAPKEDEIQDIQSQSVIGSHENGVLRTQFKRKRNTGDSTDKQFDTECWKMMFPVSGGRLDGSGNVTIHSVTPLVSDRQVCIRSCREQQKPKAEPSTCESEYRYPQDCKTEECEYIAKWNYNSKEKDVRFEISSKNMGRWTGIGFSKDGLMANSDMYTGWVYDGKAYVTDRFAYGRQLPAIDPGDRQDIYDIGGKMVDDMQTIWFSRKLITADKMTDFPLNQCYYFMFPIGGGRVIAKKSSDFTNPRTPIGYHDLYSPRVSPQKICLCDEQGTKIANDDTPTRVRVKRQAPKDPFAASETTKKHHSKDHPMFCTDMVVASVSDGRIRVKDFYSPSKATPRPDSFYGGEDSLTAASAFQEDGVTTVVFRRKLDSKDKYDHPISEGPMTVIWAKGADANNYQHTTGGPTIKADPDFFAPGTFKYHGKNKRGMLTIDFFNDKKTDQVLHGLHMDTSTCTGQYALPEGCQGSACSYLIQWMSDGVVARFTLRTALESSQWSALGFSAEGSMPGSDVIIMGLHDGQVTVTDQFMPNYGRPIIDEQQDIFDIETLYRDGVLTANFSRALSSDDKKDINLQECIYLLYTPNAGLLEKSGELRKHTEQPVISHRKVCLNSCSEVSAPVTTTSSEKPETTETTTEKSTEATETSTKTTTEVSSEATEATETTTKATTVPSTTTTTEKPALKMPPHVPATKKSVPFTVYEPTEPVKARYGLWVRILNKEFVPELTDPQTEYYQSFTKQVTNAIDAVLEKRWKNMKVSKILAYSKGSVIAEFEVVATGAVPKPIEVKSLLEESAIRGPVADIQIEASTVKARELLPNVSEAGLTSQMKMLIAIGAITVIVLIVLICVTCLFCKCQSKKRYSSYPLPQPAPYPYGTMNMHTMKAGGPVGFDNAAFHSRQYSQATLSTKPGQPSPPVENEMTPDGMGETTYQEWYSKVGSKPASQQHEEASIPPQRPPSTQPYVSYPNDPAAYYTLGGEHRTRQEQPKYFRY